MSGFWHFRKGPFLNVPKKYGDLCESLFSEHVRRNYNSDDAYEDPIYFTGRELAKKIGKLMESKS